MMTCKLDAPSLHREVIPVTPFLRSTKVIQRRGGQPTKVDKVLEAGITTGY